MVAIIVDNNNCLCGFNFTHASLKVNHLTSDASSETVVDLMHHGVHRLVGVSAVSICAK